MAGNLEETSKLYKETTVPNQDPQQDPGVWIKVKSVSSNFANIDILSNLKNLLWEIATLFLWQDCSKFAGKMDGLKNVLQSIFDTPL